MSNWSISAGTCTETIGAGTGAGTTVTSSSSPNTKGSYATIGTAGFQYSSFLLCIGNNSASRYRIDIAINTGGSDQIVVQDLYLDCTSSSSIAGNNYQIPVKIPSGASVKARCQAVVFGGQTLSILIVGFAQDFPGMPGFSGLLTGTDFTDTDPANAVTQTGQTFTAWTTIAASTASRASGLLIYPSSAGDTSRTVSRVLIQIAKGGAGAEVTVASFLSGQISTAIAPAVAGVFVADIPAGSRLSFRCQCSSNTAADSISMAAGLLVP